MITTATIISRHTMELARPLPEDMATKTVNRYHELVVQALSKLEPFQNIEKGIRANRSLSAEGIQQQLLKLTTDSLANWEPEGRVLRALEADMTKQQSDLFTIKPTITDDLLRHHRAREIRDRMAALNQAERDQAYLKASQEDQPETLLALTDAPGGSWVTADIRERADTERARHQQPDLFAAYSQNQFLHERFHGLVDHTAQWLRSFGTPPATVASTLGLAPEVSTEAGSASTEPVRSTRPTRSSYDLNTGKHIRL